METIPITKEPVMQREVVLIEQPFSSAGSEQWLRGRYEQVVDPLPEHPAYSGFFQDPGLASLLSADRSKHFDLLLAGKLKLQSTEPLNIGDNLAVEIEVIGSLEPVKTLAVVVGQVPQKMDGMFVSALRFLAVSPGRAATA
jgi:hypothetical protein